MLSVVQFEAAELEVNPMTPYSRSSVNNIVEHGIINLDDNTYSSTGYLKSYQIRDRRRRSTLVL